MLIVTWSGIGSVTRAPIGVWRALPGLRSMAESSVREVVEVARARTVSLDDDHATATLRALDGVPPDSMVSMQRDILNGRPSELEAQSGAVVRLGGATDVAAPTHAFIYHSLAQSGSPAERRTEPLEPRHLSAREPVGERRGAHRQRPVPTEPGPIQ
jgi:2-dehydropantoate 2-reductase